MSWEELQEELFEQLFKTNEEYITLEELLKKLEPISKIWADLENILIKDCSNDFDFWRTIDKIKIFSNYIIIQLGLWEYIIIDSLNKKSLTDEECKTIFDEQFFLTHFNEPETENKFSDMYYFENAGTQETINSLIKYIDIYQNLLMQENSIYYSIDYLNSRVVINIKFDKLETTIGFATFKNFENNSQPSNVNYLFFNKSAEITGASNPTNNHESLLAMGKRALKVRIPLSVIPDFIKDEKQQKLVFNSKETNNAILQ